MTRRQNKQSDEQSSELLEGVTPQQQRFIEHLLTGKNITQAAILAGASKRTGFYWMADRDSVVRLEYEKQRAYAQQALHNHVATIHNLAFSALEDMLSPKTPPFIRMQALKLIYESHLSPLFTVRHPRSTVELVGDGLERYHKEQLREGYHNIQLYDENGNERIDE